MNTAACNLCGGTAGHLNDGGNHNLCTARANLGLPTPCLGDRCPTCNGSGTTGHGGVFLSFDLGPAAIARSIAAQFPPCPMCKGAKSIVAQLNYPCIHGESHEA